MSQKETEGEKKFLEFCKHNHILCKKILEGNEKRADFRITVSGKDLIVENKDIGADSGDQEVMNKINEAKVGKAFAFWGGDVDGNPGQKIDDARRQIRETLKFFNEGLPSIVLIYDTRRPSGILLSPTSILETIEGKDTVLIDKQTGNIIGEEFGKEGGKKVGMMFRNNDNNIISAIGKLVDSGSNLAIHLFHNRRAFFPLDPLLFKDYKQVVFQFELPKDLKGKSFSDWKEISF